MAKLIDFRGSGNLGIAEDNGTTRVLSDEESHIVYRLIEVPLTREPDPVPPEVRYVIRDATGADYAGMEENLARMSGEVDALSRVVRSLCGGDHEYDETQEQYLARQFASTLELLNRSEARASALMEVLRKLAADKEERLARTAEMSGARRRTLEDMDR